MKAQLSILLAAALVQCSRAPAAGRGPAVFPTEGPGPALGEALPPFEAPDQDGVRRSFESLRGPNGLLLNFNRSVVW